MPHEAFWTQALAATEYTRLARVCAAVCVAAGELAPKLATLGRRMDSHAAAWRELVPESVLLEPARAAAPEPAVARDVAALTRELEHLGRALEALLERTTPIADAAARRIAREVLADVDEALADLGAGGSR